MVAGTRDGAGAAGFCAGWQAIAIHAAIASGMREGPGTWEVIAALDVVGRGTWVVGGPVAERGTWERRCGTWDVGDEGHSRGMEARGAPRVNPAILFLINPFPSSIPSASSRPASLVSIPRDCHMPRVSSLMNPSALIAAQSFP